MLHYMICNDAYYCWRLSTCTLEIWFLFMKLKVRTKCCSKTNYLFPIKIYIFPRIQDTTVTILGLVRVRTFRTRYLYLWHQFGQKLISGLENKRAIRIPECLNLTWGTTCLFIMLTPLSFKPYVSISMTKHQYTPFHIGLPTDKYNALTCTPSNFSELNFFLRAMKRW